MKYEYTPTGVCSRKIILDVEDGVVNDVEFIGGCNGNLKGIATLVKGMKTQDGRYSTGESVHRWDAGL